MMSESFLYGEGALEKRGVPQKVFTGYASVALALGPISFNLGTTSLPDPV